MFLKTNKTQIVDEVGKPVFLRGVNLGGWLMMEGYILHSPNIAEQVFKKDFVKRLSRDALLEFEQSFRSNYITKTDIETIADQGFNCIRVPFNHKLIEKKLGQFDLQGVGWLDKVISWAKASNIYVILDLHAAPGSQNHDWHGDSSGVADLWDSPMNQSRTLALWEFLADRYKNNKTVAGYDLLNEAVIDDASRLNKLYHQIIKRIRKVDPNHILFVEGNKWATDLACLDRFEDDNLVLSIHSYEPIDFTFNFVPGTTFGKDVKSNLRAHLMQYQKISLQRARPIFCGEFGVNARFGHFAEQKWTLDMVELFKEFGFHWTYWTYKAMKNSVFPDGLFSYCPNPAWVNRMGPKMGFQTYADCWEKQKKDMCSSWKTSAFDKQEYLLSVLRKGL